MLAVLLAISATLAQGVPTLPTQGGTVTGVLRSATGTPAAGVRVMALARPDAIKDLAAASSFAGLGETDAAGRYRLESIPPGRYYIIAGRVDAPTFYPGTVVANEGTLVLVTPAATLSGIDFVLNAASMGRAGVGTNQGGLSWIVALRTEVEGGGKIPVSWGDRFPVLRFAAPSVRTDAVLTDPNVSLPGQMDYRVTVEGLPEGYLLKSLTFGSLDLKNNPLTLTGTPAPGSPILQASIMQGHFTVGSFQGIVATLTPPASSQRGGVRVSGGIPGILKRSLYISGVPGTIYTDGTYEFLGVPPGLHMIATRNNGAEPTLGAAIVVGTGDLANVELEKISVAPAAPNGFASVAPAGNRAPGSRVPQAMLRGRIVDAETREPFNAGKAYLNGDHGAGFSLDDEGRFEIPRLLPGSYDLEVFVYGVGSVKRAVVIDGADVSIDLSLGP